jgi:hypothetical protein
MKFSALYVLIPAVFAFCIFIIRRAKKNHSINEAETRSLYLLLLAFFIWTLISLVLGIKGIHLSLMKHLPLLWQACIPIIIAVIYLIFSKTLRNALRGIASATPWHWIVFLQALRIGALGGVMKGIKGEITSSFVFWIGIPDFFFGVSAIIVGWLIVRNAIGSYILIIWNLIGAAIILLPTFIPMSFWMHEPGFFFIFEFPMVLAPSIIVPVLICFNFLLAWGIFAKKRE